MKSILLASLILFSSMTGAVMAQDKGVVEIVTMNLKDGVSVEAFAPVDKAIEDQHVSNPASFRLRRPSAGASGSSSCIGSRSMPRRLRWTASPRHRLRPNS
ncbi:MULTISPECIES: hypothetical protein [unclassified Mesorhizobium]|uniref:hypothetical protein n=1 Tax=unclassified Mesorhizobium TaxID=325217 RepID=UPI001AED0584|nr:MULTISPECIES: hypothetical protein [unclassified Mesorhizobium]